MIWKESYKVGVNLIDTQHEELFRRVTDFVETLRSTETGEEKSKKVSATLTFMQDYVVSHFRDEENYQRKIGYPGLEAHVQVHLDMVEYVLSVSEQFEREGYHEQIMQQFAGKLLAWLINHVLVDDQKIAAYAREKGVSGNE